MRTRPSQSAIKASQAPQAPLSLKTYPVLPAVGTSIAPRTFFEQTTRTAATLANRALDARQTLTDNLSEFNTYMLKYSVPEAISSYAGTLTYRAHMARLLTEITTEYTEQASFRAVPAPAPPESRTTAENAYTYLTYTRRILHDRVFEGPQIRSTNPYDNAINEDKWRALREVVHVLDSLIEKLAEVRANS